MLDMWTVSPDLSTPEREAFAMSSQAFVFTKTPCSTVSRCFEERAKNRA